MELDCAIAMRFASGKFEKIIQAATLDVDPVHHHPSTTMLIF
jgi:hypothetical protein